ncbi:MAG: 3-oxoacyl-ACP synthase III [Gemmataceae bacterium]
MKYSSVFIDAIGFELAPVVVTSEELEARLAPVYRGLHIPDGQLEALTGIRERRWWEEGHSLATGAARAAEQALAEANVAPSDIDILIYAGVCREQFEPATACKVAAQLGISDAAVYDISNACLGVLNGMLEIANRIELGQIRAGLVVSCETAREINEITIQRLLDERSMDLYKTSLATLTGGSGAVAVLLTDGSFAHSGRRRLLGGAVRSAPEHYQLCRWGMDPAPHAQAVGASEQEVAERVEAILLNNLHQKLSAVLPTGMANKVETLLLAAMRKNLEGILPASVTRRVERVLPAAFTQFMSTDSISVLKHGVTLGLRTWSSFLRTLGWMKENIDKVICHQVGSGHRDAILESLGIPEGKDFSTYAYLGNMGTVSLPLTAALAEQREFLQPGDRVGFLGIGSGLNCLMLGIDW